MFDSVRRPAPHCRSAATVFIATAAAIASVFVSGTRIGAAAGIAVVQDGAKSVWGGAYTQAQADRGRGQYLKECASCHADNMQGGDEAPGLIGSGFLAQWVDLSAGDLFERTRTTMPQDRPGQLSRAAYADILAHVFKANGFPSGDVELPTDSTALKTIMIEPKPDK